MRCSFSRESTTVRFQPGATSPAPGELSRLASPSPKLKLTRRRSLAGGEPVSERDTRPGGSCHQEKLRNRDGHAGSSGLRRAGESERSRRPASSSPLPPRRERESSERLRASRDDERDREPPPPPQSLRLGRHQEKVR